MVHKINEGYGAWRALKSVLTNRRFGINEKKRTSRSNCTNDVVRSRDMGMRNAERRILNVLEMMR